MSMRFQRATPATLVDERTPDDLRLSGKLTSARCSPSWRWTTSARSSGRATTTSQRVPVPESVYTGEAPHRMMRVARDEVLVLLPAPSVWTNRKAGRRGEIYHWSWSSADPMRKRAIRAYEAGDGRVPEAAAVIAQLHGEYLLAWYPMMATDLQVPADRLLQKAGQS